MKTEPNTSFESDLWDEGVLHIAGLDEAGRGALAGPVAVGAVILPNDKTLLSSTLAGVNDSKQLTPRKRESLAKPIMEVAIAWAVGFATADEIDMQGIVRATRLAAIRALHQFTITPQYLLTDYRLELPQIDIPQTSIIKGDAHCLFPALSPAGSPLLPARKARPGPTSRFPAARVRPRHRCAGGLG